MAEIHWLDSNGNWTTKADWTDGMVPGPTDEAVLDAAGSYTVSENSSSTAPINVDSIEISPGAVLAITDVAGNQVGLGGVTNSGTLDLDTGGGNGGSSLTIGGTLTNTNPGTVQIGPNNLTLGAATTLTLGGLVNPSGASFLLYGSAAHAVTLAFGGAGEFTVNGGNFQRYYGAALTLNNDFNNSGTFASYDSAPLTVTGAFTNSGTLDLDTGGGNGGSSLTIGGTLTNTNPGTVQIGPNNLTLGAATTLTLGGLVNPSGASFLLYGSAAHAVTLAFGGAGEFTVNGGNFQRYYGAALTLNNDFNNSGTFASYDSAPLTVTGAFTNSGTLDLDTGGGNGGSSLTIGGTLTNTNPGTVQIGPNNLTLGAATTLTLGGLVNPSGASFLLYGSAAHAVTLAFGGAGEFTGNGGNFQRYYGAALTLNNDFNNSGTFASYDSAPLTVTGAFTNSGTLDLDTGGGNGGSSLTIGGTLTNTNPGTVQIGPNNLTLGAATTLTLGGLVNPSGASFLLYGSAAHAVTLAFGGAGEFTVNGGNFQRYYGAALTLNNDFNNSGTFASYDSAPLTVTGAFTNSGTLDLDTGGGNGGSSLTIGGTLTNTNPGTVQIGPNNLTLGAATTLTLGGLVNPSGASFLLYGSAAHAVTLAFGGAGEFTGNGGNFQRYYGAALTLNNDFNNSGTFASYDSAPLTVTGAFTNSGTLDLDTGGGNGGSSLTIGGTLTNTNPGTVQIGPNNLTLGAATTLTLGGLVNPSGASFLLYGSAAHAVTLAFGGAGEFTVNGGNFQRYYGAALTLNNDFNNSGTFASYDSAPLTVTGAFTNSGTLDLDTGGGNGGSSLTIGGTLTNTNPGTVQIGPNNLTLGAATTLTLGGLVNPSGASFLLYGSAAHAVTLAFGGAGEFTGNGGNFQRYYGAALTLNNDFNNSGTFASYDSAPLTVTGAFTNSGTLDLDTGGGNGGSSLTIGGTLTNTNPGTVQIGPNNLTLGAATTLTLGGLVNPSGASFLLYGSASDVATLSIVAAPGTVASNAGTLNLQENTSFTTSVGVGFTNSGLLFVDAGGGEGGSTVNVGGTLTNSNTFQIGPNNFTLSANTTATAAGLSNSTGATFTLYGSAAHPARLALTGNAINSGTMNVGGFSAINAAGEIYTQSLGTTTLAATGALTAKTIDVTGGVFQGAGTVTGNIVNTGGSVAGGTYTSNSPGTLTVTGTYSQSGSGILEEVLTGTAAGQQSELVVSGDANIQGGTLNADVSFGLAAGETFTVMTFAPGTLPGLFGAIDYGSSVGNRTFVNITGGLTLGALYNVAAGNIELQVLTTPATTADLWSGGSGNWSTAADWTTGVVPTSDTDVTIGQTASGTVTLDTGDTIDSLTIVSGNTLNFAANEALVVGANVTVQSGGALTLAGGDGLEVGGTLGVAGQMTVGAGATVELFSTPLNVTGTLTVAGEIETAGATAVTMGSGIDRLILDPGFSFVGLVQGGGVNSTLELAAGAGTGVLNALGTEFTDFGTVRVDAGATWTVDALAAALSGVTITGSDGSNTLVITSSGAADLSGVSGFPTIDLASGGNNVAVTNNIFALTPPDGSVTINVTGGNNSISAAGDTSASTGKTLTYVAATGIDSFTGGFENDVVYVPAAAVGGDTLTGGSGTNTLVLKSAGMFSLGGVSKFGTIDLAAGNSTVTMTDTTLSGGSVRINDGASGNNSISAAGDTSASTGKTLTYMAGAGTDSFTGGFENDVVYVPATAVGGDTLTGGSGTNTLVLKSAGTFSLGGVSKFGTIDLFAGNSTVTVTDTTLSGGLVTIWAGASGSNKISAAGDTSASTGKTLRYVTGTGTDSFTGGFENDVVYVPAAAVGGDTLTGGGGTNTLVLRSAGTFSLGGVSKFGTIDLAAGNSTVTMTDTTLSGGSVRINDGASGNNSISAAGDTSASTGKTLTYVAGTGIDSFTGGFENDVVYVPAAAVGGDTLTGGSGTNTLVLTTEGTFNLSGLSGFWTIDLAPSNNTVTVTLSGGSVRINDGASGNNTISAAGDTSASTGKTLTYMAGAGTDSFTGGFENDVVYVPATAVGGDTLTGGSGTNTLVLKSAGTFSLGGVSKFATIDLFAGNSTVTVTDTTLSGGSVTIWDGASGSNKISAAGDTSASTGKTLRYVAGAGIDSFTGGFENDVVYVPAAAVGGDTLTGGSGTNTLVLRSAGTFSLGGVSKFGTIDLAAGNSTVTVTDTTLSGGLVRINDGASGNNTISAAGDTSASTGKTLTYMAGTGTDSFTGGFENDVVYVPATAVGGDTLTGGSGTNTLVLKSAGTFSLGGVSKFATIDLFAGNSTVTVTDTTLSGGSVTIWDGASGNNSISAAGDTSASTGKTLRYVAGAGIDSFTGGFENDVVYVPAAAVGGDTLTGGSGTNTLVLRSAGTFSLGGVSKFGTIDLAAGNSTVTVTDTTLSGGLVRINDGASGNNTISAAGDTSASTGKTLTYMAGTGTDSFTGGFENDVVYVPAAAVGGDTLTGGSGTNTLNVSGGGAAVMGSTITGISTVNLLKAPSGQTQPDYDFTANTLSGLLVDDLNTTTPDALVAGGNRQTLTGGGAGMLTMDAANQSSALLKDSASVFSGDTTKDLVNGDMIDITGLGFSAVNTSLGFVYNSGSDTTTMSVALSGTQKTAITLLGQYMAADFSVSADTAGTGTLITLTHELNLTMPH